MQRLHLCVAAGMLAALGIPSPGARADNPRLSVRLDKVTAFEAADALGRAASIPIDVVASPYVPGDPPPTGPHLREPASFDWSRARLSHALRELCERYRLSPYWGRAGGLRLVVRQALPGATPSLRAVYNRVVERHGVRLFARGLSLSTFRFAGGDAQDEAGRVSLALQLGCELPDGDGETIAGVENVRARDDRGNTLVRTAQTFYSGLPGVGAFPDEWSGTVSLDGYQPEATRLRLVEGDLMGYRRLRSLRATLSVPAEGGSSRTRVADAEIVVSDRRHIPRPAEGPGAAEPLLSPSVARARWGTVLRVRISASPDSRIAPRRMASPLGARGSWPPYAVGASGRLYAADDYWGQASRIIADGSTRESTFIFPAGEPLVRLVWELVEKPDPQRLFSFRLTDLPLPQVAGFVPQPVPSPGIVVTAEGPFLFHHLGGGTLVSRVERAGEAVSGGTLSLGLSSTDPYGSEERGRDSAAASWTRVDVGRDGTAQLPDLRPGIYRLLRVYHPPASEHPALWPPGRWRNGETLVEVVAGKSATPAPLLWEAAGPAPTDREQSPRRRQGNARR